MSNTKTIDLGSLNLSHFYNSIVKTYLKEEFSTMHDDNVMHISRNFSSAKLFDEIESKVFHRKNVDHAYFQTKVVGPMLSIESIGVEIPLLFSIEINGQNGEKFVPFRADRISDIAYYDTLIRNCEKQKLKLNEEMQKAYSSFSFRRNFEPFCHDFEFTINVNDELMFGKFSKFQMNGFKSLRVTKIEDLKNFTKIDDAILRFHLDEKHINELVKLVKYAKTYRLLATLRTKYIKLMTKLLEAKFHTTIDEKYFTEEEVCEKFKSNMMLKYKEHVWIWKLDMKYFTNVQNHGPMMYCEYKLTVEREECDLHTILA